MNLLIDIGHPYNINAHTGKIALFGFLQYACKVAPVESSGIELFATIINAATIVDIVGGVAVAEAVGNQEINGSIAPRERCVGRSKERSGKKERSDCQENILFHDDTVFMAAKLGSPPHTGNTDL